MATQYKLKQGALGGVAPRDITFPIPEEGEVFRDLGSNQLMYMKGGQIYRAPSGMLTNAEKVALGGSPAAITRAETEKFLQSAGIDYGGDINKFISGLRTQNVGDLQTAGLVKVQNQQLQFGEATPEQFKSIYDAYQTKTFGTAQAPTETITGAGAQTYQEVTPTPTAPTPTGLGKKIEGFPQTQAQMAEWQKKYKFDSATGAWYEKVGGVGFTPTLTEARPQYTPVAGIGTISPGGQWRYVGGTPGQDWVQVGGQTGATGQPGGAGGVSGAGAGATGETPEQAAERERQEYLKIVQDWLDTNAQPGSTAAVTGEKITAPTAPSYEAEFEEKIKAVEPLETDLANIRKEKADLIALYEGAITGEKGRLAPMAIIRQRQAALSDEQRIELDRLTRQEIAIQEQLNTKYKTIDTLMQLKQMDYNTARGNYEFEYNKAIQSQQLLNQARDDARANLTAMTNLFASVQLSWSDLSYDQQMSIAKMEMAAGMPVGTIQAFMMTKPKVKLLDSVSGYDAQGNAIITFIYQDENGMPGVSYTLKTGGIKAPEEPESTTGANYNTRINQEITNLYSGRYGKEGAREKVINMLKAEFPNLDVAKDIYVRVPDGYENQIKEIKPQSKLDESWLKQNFPKKLLESDDAYNKRIQTYLAAIQAYSATGMSDEEIIKQMK